MFFLGVHNCHLVKNVAVLYAEGSDWLLSNVDLLLHLSVNSSSVGVSSLSIDKLLQTKSIKLRPLLARAEGKHQDCKCNEICYLLQ